MGDLEGQAGSYRLIGCNLVVGPGRDGGRGVQVGLGEGEMGEEGLKTFLDTIETANSM